MTPRVRAVFLGSGEFALPVLAALADHAAVELRAVVTAPPRPVGRRQQLTPTPVGRWATEQRLPMLTPPRLRAADAVAQVGALEPELLVLADYGQIVPAALLEMPRHGALNLHPSLLPRHRGAAPIPATILAGDEETGVTLMLMDEGLDSGPILAQEGIRLRGDETAPLLERQLATLAAVVLAENLRAWLGGLLEPVAQSEDAATMTRPLRRADGLLDPRRPAAQLERQVRALQPWPGSYLETGAGRITVWSADVEPAMAGDEAGTIVVGSGGTPALATVDGRLLLGEAQPAGGRRMTGSELLRGRPALVGTRVDSSAGASPGRRG